MFIKRDYIVKTGKVILKTIEDGFPTTRVFYGRNSSMYKKGVAKMEMFDCLDGRKIYDFYDKKGIALTESIIRTDDNKTFSQKLRNFILSLG